MFRFHFLVLHLYQSKKTHPKPSIHPPSRGSFSAQAPPCPCSSNRDVITSTIQSVKHGLPMCKTFLRIGVCESNKHPLCKWPCTSRVFKGVVETSLHVCTRKNNINKCPQKVTWIPSILIVERNIFFQTIICFG